MLHCQGLYLIGVFSIQYPNIYMSLGFRRGWAASEACRDFPVWGAAEKILDFQVL